jgi:hypothetical protein
MNCRPGSIIECNNSKDYKMLESSLPSVAKAYYNKISNGNVSIDFAANTNTLVAKCKNCTLIHIFTNWEDIDVVINKSVDEFCKDHRHDIAALDRKD